MCPCKEHAQAQRLRPASCLCLELIKCPVQGDMMKLHVVIARTDTMMLLTRSHTVQTLPSRRKFKEAR